MKIHIYGCNAFIIEAGNRQFETAVEKTDGQCVILGAGESVGLADE